MMRRGLGLFVLVVAVGGCGDDGDGPRPTPTTTPSATASATVPPTFAVPTSTAPPSATPIASATRTITPIATLTPAPTATPVPPQLLFFGVARADDLVQAPDAVDAAGRPIFLRAQGQGMTLIVEGRRGGARLSAEAYDPVGFAPGVEIIASRPLGDGSPAVCDYDTPIIGGVPGVDPPDFSDNQMVRDAVADLGCRFNDGTGAPRGRNSNNACTRDAGALFSFVDPSAELQYCLPIAKAWSFAPGDTIVAARVRDVTGQVSEVREIVIRVAGDVPFDCDSGLGERPFTAQTPASRLVVSGQGTVSQEPWVTAPLRLCAGPDVGDGTHALTLREDALFGIPLIDGEVLCVQFRARGSAGVLDCGNNAAQDVYAAADQASGRITVDSGLGIPAGTGSASLRVPVAFRVLSSGSAPIDCLEADFASTISDALTTATATAEVLDEHGAAVASLARVGAPFSCDAWRDGGSPVLVLPVPATDPVAGSVAAVLVLAD
ncbi:MAG TPA: hypothetical protein VL049_13500 [Candidatus Dormibacteraeota bacterium]|nr:hypothetical protein [Candidatus Dormibacteraeota bacterium]